MEPIELNNPNETPNERIMRQANELRKKQDKENFELVANIFVNILDNINKRHDAVKDPSTKYALLVDKLCLGLDAGLAVMKTMMDQHEIEPELKIKIEDASSKLQSQLTGLMNWVINPVYGPDHPYGNSMMNSAATDFKTNLNKN